MGRRFAIVYVLVLAMLAGGTAAAGAAPKTGCPAGSWEELSISAAAATIFPGLLDPEAFGGTQQALEELIDGALDRNDDDSVCVKTVWGDHLNENSHWYKVGMEVLGFPAPLFIIVENNANGSSSGK